MLAIRSSADAGSIDDPAIRRLVQQRFADVLDGETYDPDVHGEFVVAEAGDTLESIEKDTGLPLTSSLFDTVSYPDPAFRPNSEWIEDLGAAYLMYFLFTDDGVGTSVFIPEAPGIDADLLEFCATYAERA